MEKDKSDLKNSHEALQDEIKGAVEMECDVRDAVRRITLKALSEGQLDSAEIRQVASAVVKGAGLGAASHGAAAGNVLARAVSGLDDALSAVAEASKLALQEAAGHIKSFTKEDFKRATDDLLALEEMYLDILKQVAEEADETIAETLKDLLAHARHSGTVVGRHATAIVELLTRDLGETLNETVTAGSESTLKVASQLAHAAAGFLDGIAQTLDGKLKKTPPTTKK